MNSPWNDARSYQSEPLERRSVAHRVVEAFCIALSVFCIVYFGGLELLAAFQ